MSLTKFKDMYKENTNVYLIIRQDILGTAEDDVILGYKDTKKEAEEFVKSISKEFVDDEFNYYIKEISELKNV